MHGRWSRKTTLGVILSLLLLLILSIPVYALIGDINLDDLVNASDLAVIVQSLGTYQNDPTYYRFADLNQDNYVNVADLAIAGRSYGSTRNFHYPRQISNSGHNIIYLSSCIDASDRIHIAWSEDNNVYYTRLDHFGNTLIDDLLLEHGGFAGNSGLGIGCDDEGNSYVIWDCADAIGGTCQARIDQYGFLRYAGILDTRRAVVGWPAIDLDSYHRAHLLYTQSVTGKSSYIVIDPNGTMQISREIIPSAHRFEELVVDESNAAHLLYPVYTDTYRLAYQRIGYGATPSLGERTLGVLGWEGAYNESIRPSMALDADNNVFVSYLTFGTLPPNLYLEKLDSAGNTIINDKLIILQYNLGSGQAQTDIGMDSTGNLHMISFTDFGSGAVHPAYGIFDNDAIALKPLRWIIYGGAILAPTLLLDSQNETHLIYKAGDSSGYPPCGTYTLCYQGTAFDAGAYNRTLPDLGIDAAHLYWDPGIARWNNPLTITGTVFNAGWYTATATTIRVSVAITDTDITPLASTDVAVPSLGPYHSYQFEANLLLPHSPPLGFETLKFARLLLDVDPTHLINETTEANNHLSLPLPVQPIPTKTGLYMVIRDDTYTVIGGEGVLANTGIAAIQGPGYPRKEMDVTDYTTVLADDVPVGTSTITYTIEWEAKDYRVTHPAEIGVKRNAIDPYKIDYYPSNTAVMPTDRWGTLSGTITGSAISQSESAGGVPLEGAKVRLVGQGLSIEATTDNNGNFSPAGQSALGKLIPGDYQIRISRANYARIVDSFILNPLEDHIYDLLMEPTTKAYVHGNLINDFGNPVANAKVDACGIGQITESDGVFDLEVEASCTTLSIRREYYLDMDGTLDLTAGLEYLFDNLTLTFYPPVSIVGGGNRVASRVIDESTGDILPDAPDDAGFALEKLYEKFKDEFWIDYRILVLYGCYEYNVSAAYSGPPDDRHLLFVQVSLAPKTFEVHMSLSSIDFLGVTIPIPIVSDSGLRTAIYGIEARLVNAHTGHVIMPIRNPIEGGGTWLALEDTIRTYDFGGIKIDDWDNTEVWFYLKTGLNSGGSFGDSPLLYQYDQQILKLDLSSGSIYGDYGLGDFPSP